MLTFNNKKMLLNYCTAPIKRGRGSFPKCGHLPQGQIQEKVLLTLTLLSSSLIIGKTIYFSDTYLQSVQVTFTIS